jgi:hypothetical protein
MRGKTTTATRDRKKTGKFEVPTVGLSINAELPVRRGEDNHLRTHRPLCRLFKVYSIAKNCLGAYLLVCEKQVRSKTKNFGVRFAELFKTDFSLSFSGTPPFIEKKIV